MLLSKFYALNVSLSAMNGRERQGAPCSSCTVTTFLSHLTRSRIGPRLACFAVVKLVAPSGALRLGDMFKLLMQVFSSVSVTYNDQDLHGLQGP